uniref:Uncharacterized protein n=1 Tax=Tetradesmus obliquus TaxID=3088 RepID=A0A383W8V6_TETOB|eukprot:jgi/Sobl393_1/4889/SZX73851.1
MLQRGIPSALQWAPAALSSAGCQLQQQLTAAQIGVSCCSATASSSSNSFEGLGFCLRQQRSFRAGVVDVRGQPRRKKYPYFNPDDGPEGYQYWKDMWANPQKAPKPRPRNPKTLPVYLEPDEQQALMEAAVAAGVPRHLAEGDKSRQVPRLIAAVVASGGRIPTDPDRLADRVSQLLALQRSVPGLDVARIFKANGFAILAEKPKDVAQQITYLANRLKAAGVAAEPGLLMSAAVKPALRYPMGIVQRAQQLPELLGVELGDGSAAAAAAAAGRVLQHPFQASLLNKSSRALQRHAHALVQRHGQEQAAAMYSKLPQLLLYRTHNLRNKTAAIAEALGLSPGQADQLVRSDPRLMTYAPETLQQRAVALQELLGLPGQPALRKVVLGWPSLLRKRTQSIADKLKVLQEQLALQDANAAAAVMRQHPYLASYSAAALQQPLQHLQQLDDSSPLADLKPKAAEVLRAKPWLLTLGGDAAAGPERSLAGRLQLLDQLAGISDSWRAAVSALAGSSAADVAAVVGSSGFVERVQWLLQQRPEQPPAKEEVGGLYGLVTMRLARFEMRYPGFVAQQKERQVAAKQAASVQQ